MAYTLNKKKKEERKGRKEGRKDGWMDEGLFKKILPKWIEHGLRSTSVLFFLSAIFLLLKLTISSRTISFCL